MLNHSHRENGTPFPQKSSRKQREEHKFFNFIFQNFLIRALIFENFSLSSIHFTLEKYSPTFLLRMLLPFLTGCLAFFIILTFQEPTLEHFSLVQGLLQCLQLPISRETKLAKPREGQAWIHKQQQVPANRRWGKMGREIIWECLRKISLPNNEPYANYLCNYMLEVSSSWLSMLIKFYRI